jgi:hypothetical protein
MGDILQVIIRKDYAASLIEHLQKEEAIEIVSKDILEIPEWEKEAVRKTLIDIQDNPEQLLSWDLIKKKYKPA